MKLDRFKDFEPKVRELVLRFEKQRDEGGGFLDVDQLEVVADYYMEVYDVEGLEAAVSMGERLFPTNDGIRLRRAHLLGIQGQYGKALKLLQELENHSPNDTDVCYALGALYSMTDQGRKSISYYLKAAVDGYELGTIYGNVADEYYKLGDMEQAVRYYRKAVAEDPNEQRSLYNLACTWDALGRHEDAEAFFSKQVMEHPYSNGAWYCLGCVYGWMGLYEKAADAYEYAVAIDKTQTDAYFGLSDCCRRMGDFGRAVQALRDALESAPDRPYVLYSIGRLYLDAGNYHTASTYLHDALNEDPSYALAWNNLGLCSESLGYDEEAAGYYRRAIDLDPDTDSHWLCLADLYLRTQRFAQAAALLEESRIDAEDPFPFVTRLCYCYFKMGKRERLLDLLLSEKHRFPSLGQTLLTQYPDMRNDIDLVTLLLK